MKRLVQSTGYARFRFVNGVIFIVLGIVLFAQFAHAVGLRWQGVSGYVLALAFIGLGLYRMRMGWPRRSP